MNIKLLMSACLAAVLSIMSLDAQTVNVSNAKVGKIKNLNYVGASATHFYYTAAKNALYLFERKNLTVYTTFNMVFDDKKENHTSVKIVDEKLFVFTNRYQKGKTDHTTIFTTYRFDPMTGAKIKSVKTGGTTEKYLYYNSAVDTATKNLRICLIDSVVMLLDYNLDPVPFDKDVKVKRESTFNLADLMLDIDLLFQSFNINGVSSTTAQPKTMVDSGSVKDYIASYLRKEDLRIPFFKKAFDKVTFNSRKKNAKRKDFEFELSSDKKIIDLLMLEDKSGNLIVVGKYIINTEQMNHYGLFSAKYDADLQELAPLKYYDLVKNNTGEATVANKKFLGLFYSRLSRSMHKIHLDHDALLMVYQKSFNNVKDHIYLLKIESSGELVVNMIANQTMIDKKSTYRTESFVPVLTGNKLVFIFYEDPRNLDLSASEVNVAWCDPEKKSTVLVSCTYEIDNDNVRKKKMIAANSDFTTKPHLNTSVILRNKEQGGMTCLVEGETAKGVTRVLYRFDITN